MSSAEAVLRWWLAYSLVSVALAPLVWWLAAGLGRYRHALLRPVALVIATFLVWWPAALFGIPFQRETIITGIVVAGAGGWFLIWTRSRDVISEFRSLMVFELVWMTAFLGYAAFRSANPDIANTEKPMEIALLSSVTISSNVPAPDPWYAGSPINYYYFGYQSVATLIHLSGVQASVAFNLMLGSLFASTLTVASGLGAWLAERARLSQSAVWVTAGVSGFFVALAGNLETFARLVRSPGETISAGWWEGVGWQASRVIVDSGVNGNPAQLETINEFPAFSFVLGDLHPHLTTLPVLLATIALAAGLASDRRWCSWGRTAAVGAFAGLLYASNSWDAPVGVVVVTGAIVIAHGLLDRAVLLRIGVAIGGAALAALPFALSYTAPVGVSSNEVPGWLARIPVLGTLPDTIAIVTWKPSSASEILVVHGLWIVIASIFCAWAFATSEVLKDHARRHLSIVGPLALIVVAVAIAWSPALLLLGFPAVALLSMSILDSRVETRIISGIYACGFGLALIPEYLYIQDSFGSRMNTIFKLNFQAWLFLGVASAAGLLIVAGRSTGRLRSASLVVLLMSVLVTMPYSIFSAEDWMDMGIASGTLDGAAYLEITNAAEANGIAWLEKHADEHDVIVEAPGCAYQTLNGVPMNRFSAFTGVPTLLGWANHERQWRRGEFNDLSAVIDRRDRLANSWLDGTSSASPADLEPRFIIFGALERSVSDRCPLLRARGMAEIDALVASGWSIAFEEEQMTILARSDDPVIAAGFEVD